jgi:hypothetical protein
LKALPNRAFGYLIYLIVGLAWLALLSRGRMRKGDLWLLLVAGGLLFPLALSLQVPLQRLYVRAVVVPGTQRGLSILILGIGTVLLSGCVQELFKCLPLLAHSRLMPLARNRGIAVALGAGVGVGFGLVEAGMITDQALALGIISPWGIFERAFTILFHGATGGILALGIFKRAGLRYYLLAVLLHSLGNYSIILLHQNYISPTTLEIGVALLDVCILAFVLWASRAKPRIADPEAEEIAHA